MSRRHNDYRWQRVPRAALERDGRCRRYDRASRLEAHHMIPRDEATMWALFEEFVTGESGAPPPYRQGGRLRRERR